MRALSAQEVLAVWERGERQHPLDRALTVLAAAMPGHTRTSLAQLPLPERDRLLWQLRLQLFGPAVEFQLSCPQCACPMSGDFPAADLAHAVPVLEPVSLELAWLGAGSRWRPPTSEDLACAARFAGEPLAAMQHLAARCLIGAADEPPPLPEVFTADRLEELSRRVTTVRPEAETRLQLECPDCHHRWSEAFDVAGFLWVELTAQARRLLQEVDVIARAYGWTETEILRLSASRRATYLQMASQ